MPDRSEHRSVCVDTGAVYEGVRRGLISVVAPLTPDQLDGRVPATPDWSVRDVLAHVVGITVDLNRQHFPQPDDLGGSKWASAQVLSRRSCAVTDLFREWDSEAVGFEDGLCAFGYEVGSHFVADLYAHYSDVRHAIGLGRDTDRLPVEVSLDHYIGFVAELLDGSAWGEVELVAGRQTWRLGSAGSHHAGSHHAGSHHAGSHHAESHRAESHHARLSAEPFELLRTLSARRSLRQVRALDWTGDVDELLDLMQRGFGSGYAFPDADMIE